jgi:hypothetical protein
MKLVITAVFVAGILTYAAPPSLTTLQPGAVRNLSQTLDVNIVFVGYEPGAGPRDINPNVLNSILPASYRPIHRYPNFYGNREYVGLTFNFKYLNHYASSTYEDVFFTYLSSIAAPAPKTAFQDAYNSQSQKAVAIGQNYAINAVSVEKWLAQNPPAGVDTTKYTVFLINWYGRADFKFHVYTKTDEPDLDTGYNFGVVRSSRKMIGWGGNTPDDPQTGWGNGLGVRRVWFYDLSAGPESWAGSYDLVNADLDGDGAPDYRMPPVWDYGNPSSGLYRPFNNLSQDLGLIVRFVAIDLLFTTSPLYKPALSPPKLPSNLQLDISVYQGIQGFDAKTYFKKQRISQALTALQPGNTSCARARVKQSARNIQRRGMGLGYAISASGVSGRWSRPDGSSTIPAACPLCSSWRSDAFWASALTGRSAGCCICSRNSNDCRPESSQLAL